MEDNFHLGVKALIRNKRGEILLLKINLAKLKDYNKPAYWDIPGGRIKKGDSVEQTLKREVKEETGIKNIKKIIPFSMVLSKIRIPLKKDTVGLILASYLCDVEEVKEVRISNEHTEFGWFSPQKTSKLLETKYPKEFTEKIKDLK